MIARRTALIAPGLGYLALFLVLPCLIIFAYSLFERGTYGGIDYIWTWANYQRAASSLFARIFGIRARPWTEETDRITRVLVEAQRGTTQHVA